MHTARSFKKLSDGSYTDGGRLVIVPLVAGIHQQKHKLSATNSTAPGHLSSRALRPHCTGGSRRDTSLLLPGAVGRYCHPRIKLGGSAALNQLKRPGGIKSSETRCRKTRPGKVGDEDDEQLVANVVRSLPARFVSPRGAPARCPVLPLYIRAMKPSFDTCTRAPAVSDQCGRASGRLRVHCSASWQWSSSRSRRRRSTKSPCFDPRSPGTPRPSSACRPSTCPAPARLWPSWTRASGSVSSRSSTTACQRASWTGWRPRPSGSSRRRSRTRTRAAPPTRSGTGTSASGAMATWGGSSTSSSPSTLAATPARCPRPPLSRHPRCGAVTNQSADN